MKCEPPNVEHLGTCITPAEQDIIGPSLCFSNEEWVTTPKRGCKCKEGYKRDPNSSDCILEYKTSTMRDPNSSNYIEEFIEKPKVSIGMLVAVSALAALGYYVFTL